jgi:uncharacterized membrane protein
MVNKMRMGQGRIAKEQQEEAIRQVRKELTNSIFIGLPHNEVHATHNNTIPNKMK